MPVFRQNRITIWGGRLVTPQIDGTLTIRDHVVIEVVDGSIAKVSEGAKGRDVSVTPGDGHVIDARGCLITPALTDCHTHMTFAGSRADEFARRLAGESYESIARSGGGIQSTVSSTREASEDELVRLTEKRLASWLDQGVGTVEIKSGYGLSLEAESKILRAIARASKSFPGDVVATFLGAHTTPPESKADKDRYMDTVCSMIDSLAPQGLMHAVDAYCESIAFSPDQIERVFRCAKRHGLPVKLHAEQLSNSGGAIRAAQLGALSCDHLEHLSQEGVEAMAASGSVAVLLPGAFLNLRETKKPPVDALRKAGVPLALATDYNPGTSPVRSLVLCAQWACLLFGLTLEEAFLGITLEATRALGRPLESSTVREGIKAKIAIWRVSSLEELFYETGENLCQGCLVGNQWHASPQGLTPLSHLENNRPNNPSQDEESK